MFRVEVVGADDAIKQTQRLAYDRPKQFRRGVVKMALLVQWEAQRRCPVDTGALRNSAATRVTDQAPGRFTAAVVFQQTYSLWVHENLRSHHPVGEAKFLENAVRHLQPRFYTVIMSEVVKDS